MLCRWLKDYEQAIAAFQKAIDIKPDDHEAWNNLGFVYADGLKNYEQAIAAYQKAINIKPDFHEAWYNLGIVYAIPKRLRTSHSRLPKSHQHKTRLLRAWINN